MYQICGKCQEIRPEPNTDPLTGNGFDESQPFADRSNPNFSKGTNIGWQGYYKTKQRRPCNNDLQVRMFLPNPVLKPITGIDLTILLST